MCTVSFVYSHNTIIITSNRDEKVARPKAINPKTYLGNHKKMYFPKDAKAGGTWYVLDDSGNVIVLLNGAAEKHELQSNYRKSRGLILLEIFDSPNAMTQWHTIDLNNIEPFTLVVYFEKQLFQCQWDGHTKHTLELDAKGKYIWSSSTLYPAAVRKERETLFTKFTQSKTVLTPEDMSHFHEYTKEDDPENGLVINRNNTLITLSITQTVIHHNKIQFSHKDLLENQIHQNNFLML